MIIAMNDECRYEGTMVELLAEYTGVTKGLYDKLVSRYGETFANSSLALCGRLATADEGKLDEAYEEFTKMMNK